MKYYNTLYIYTKKEFKMFYLTESKLFPFYIFYRYTRA